MRNGLYMFRHSMKLSQEKMAEKCGCTRASYSAIETGRRDGREYFWTSLQKAFNIPDEKMGGLRRKDG